jgi:Fe-S-cluster-containing hydrogenase component 2
MLQFSVDKTICRRCGECSTDCPTGIIVPDPAGYPSIAFESESLCMKCQHCLAICRDGAISILGKSPSDSLPIEKGSLPEYDKMDMLVRANRSVRHYRDADVDPKTIDQLMRTLANIPTGVNAMELTFTLVADRATMRKVQSETIAAMRSAASSNVLPERYAGMLALTDDELAPRLFRNAPHVLVVSAPASSPCPEEDVAEAIAYFRMLAACAGLGSVWWGMLRFIVSSLPAVAPLFGIPKDHIFSAALFGYPSVVYARTVQRDEGATVRRL